MLICTDECEKVQKSAESVKSADKSVKVFENVEKCCSEQIVEKCWKVRKSLIKCRKVLESAKKWGEIR